MEKHFCDWCGGDLGKEYYNHRIKLYDRRKDPEGRFFTWELGTDRWDLCVRCFDELLAKIESTREYRKKSAEADRKEAMRREVLDDPDVCIFPTRPEPPQPEFVREGEFPKPRKHEHSPFCRWLHGFMCKE